MIYKDFKGIKVSALGLGAMRLPVIDGDYAAIDEAAAAEMVECAMKNGITYYDTAYGYHEGHSETVMGKLLGKYPRQSFCLASKFPGYDVANIKNKEAVFEEQLKRCCVDYFDFYLFHSVTETDIDDYLNPEYGLYDYLMEQKKLGRIRHLGFSAHCSVSDMKRFLDACGEGIEFCQIQLNYIDWTFQDAKEKVELLSKYNVPVWVMEPLRGGKLAAMPASELQRLQALRPDVTAPEWAFRFLQSIPEVTVILSGMSTLEQIQDNVRIFADDKPLSTAERNALLDIAAERLKTKTVPCTSCRYCVSHCPNQIDIPMMLYLYNEQGVSGNNFIPNGALANVDEDKKPDKCVACKSCEAVCPQGIHISDVLADFVKKLEK